MRPARRQLSTVLAERCPRARASRVEPPKAWITRSARDGGKDFMAADITIFGTPVQARAAGDVPISVIPGFPPPADIYGMRNSWLPERLKELAESGRPRSQAALARALGLAPARITEIIAGDRDISAREVAPIAEFLEWPPERVLAAIAPRPRAPDLSERAAAQPATAATAASVALPPPRPAVILEAKMRAAGMDWRRLAAAAGIAQKRLRAIAGGAEPGMHELDRIAEALDLGVFGIFDFAPLDTAEAGLIVELRRADRASAAAALRAVRAILGAPANDAPPRAGTPRASRPRTKAAETRRRRRAA
jgi:plasmid maintenance system antidote protein VapI